MGGMKSGRYKELERILKGVASHRRLRILDILGSEAELSVTDIAERLSLDFRTTSEHIRKLALAGLVMKRHDAAAVRNALTERGKVILKFCRTLE